MGEDASSASFRFFSRNLLRPFQGDGQVVVSRQACDKSSENYSGRHCGECACRRYRLRPAGAGPSSGDFAFAGFREVRHLHGLEFRLSGCCVPVVYQWISQKLLFADGGSYKYFSTRCTVYADRSRQRGELSDQYGIQRRGEFECAGLLVEVWGLSGG